MRATSLIAYLQITIPSDNNRNVGKSHLFPGLKYFQNKANLRKGSTGEGLKAVADDQPYIFSDLIAKRAAVRDGPRLELGRL